MAKNPWQKMKTEKTTLFLLLILFLATFLRFWQLDVVPPELFGDELDIGYHAYSLLKTGKDYYGQFWRPRFAGFLWRFGNFYPLPFSQGTFWQSKIGSFSRSSLSNLPLASPLQPGCFRCDFVFISFSFRHLFLAKGIKKILVFYSRRCLL